jgi:hypothetical protein
MYGTWNFYARMVANFRHESAGEYTGAIRYCPKLGVYETRIRKAGSTIGLYQTRTKSKAFDVWAQFKRRDGVPGGMWREERFDESEAFA